MANKKEDKKEKKVEPKKVLTRKEKLASLYSDK
jgi:hypothetical protein